MKEDLKKATISLKRDIRVLKLPTDAFTDNYNDIIEKLNAESIVLKMT